MHGAKKLVQKLLTEAGDLPFRFVRKAAHLSFDFPLKGFGFLSEPVADGVVHFAILLSLLVATAVTASAVGNGRRPPNRWQSRRRNRVQIRRGHPALTSNNFYPDGWDPGQDRFNAEGYGVEVARGVVIFHRWGTAEDGQLERFIVALNFSAEDRVVDVPFSTNGRWTDLLSGRTDTVSGFRLPGYRLESNWGRVWFQKSAG